ncbi:MAG: hypothetical protein ABSA69_02995 [Verrucomicrobiota bacterium]|jgi:hypothetical protein
MHTPRLNLFTVLSGLALLVSAESARADLAFELTPAVESGVVSNEIVFNGTLINTSPTDTLFLNSIQFSFIDAAAGYLAADTNVFFANVPGILAPLETYSDVVFAIVLNPAAPPGQYFGIVTVQGGTNIFDSTDLASPIFEVSVPLPALSIALSGTNVVVSWAWSSSGFVLQQNSDLTTTNWITVTNSPAVTNWQNQLLVSPGAGDRFYRLLRP